MTQNFVAGVTPGSCDRGLQTRLPSCCQPVWLTVLLAVACCLGCGSQHHGDYRRDVQPVKDATNSGRTPAGSRAPQVRLYVFDGGTTRIHDKAIFDPVYTSEGPIDLEVRYFLIEHPRGWLMFDTGHAQQSAHGENGGMTVYVRDCLNSQLASIGLVPNDIDLLGFSHWHFDHVGNANAFQRATIIGQRDEYELAFSAKAAQTFGMRPWLYERLRYNSSDLFLGDRDVFGDGTVQILRAAGHTVGSQVLFVKLNHTGPVLLSGDLYHFASQRAYRRVPPFNFDRLQTLRSMERIEAFVAREPGTTMWITHDPQQMRALKLVPHYYE